MSVALMDGCLSLTLTNDFRTDKQMRLAQMRVCAEVIRVCVRGSFIGECGSEKKLLTEQKKYDYPQTYHQSPEGTRDYRQAVES